MAGLDPTGSPDALPQGADPETLGSAVSALVGRRGWARRLRGARVHEHWHEIAGEVLAQHVEPVRLSGGVLVVRVLSPAWGTQLRYLIPQLLERANDVLGDGSVRTVTIQSSPAGRPKTGR